MKSAMTEYQTTSKPKGNCDPTFFQISFTARESTKRHQSRKAIVTSAGAHNTSYEFSPYQTTSKPKGNCDRIVDSVWYRLSGGTKRHQSRKAIVTA